MQHWPVHEIAADARFRVVREMPPLPAALDAEVDRLWAAAQIRMGGRLFNGRVFSADLITPRLVCGHWTEFRRIVAQMDRHALHPLLGVRPLAVGGVILGPDGVVFGRRPAGAIYQAGEWQLPPAGSVDPGAAGGAGAVDVVRQFLTELQEELGLPASAVHDPRLLCIVEHGGSHVLDLGVAVRTSLSAAEIRAAHAGHGNGEYDPLAVVALPALPAFLARAGALLNHQAPVFLARALGKRIGFLSD
ncbi:NUDIX hydrolase [Rhodovastum sp. RN2-1]|uniref:NUDIX hydrolase n=1 Tax=Limobrevibacterium gyesilva TaxID=2991712 RepID=A0AA42CFF8_9PROT|nr:NUDIX hydrolase [Limobrevibacterium gyesilva]